MSSAIELGYTTPHQSRSLRACMVCSIVQTHALFEKNGCPNCDSLLGLRGNPENIGSYTSANFNGVMAVMAPDKSWVAKWQRIEKYVPGMYAVQVLGTLDPDMIAQLQDNGGRYVPRDGTVYEGEMGE